MISCSQRSGTDYYLTSPTGEKNCSITSPAEVPPQNRVSAANFLGNMCATTAVLPTPDLFKLEYQDPGRIEMFEHPKTRARCSNATLFLA